MLGKRQWPLAIVMVWLTGCGNPGPRPHPGDTIHTKFFASIWSMEQRSVLHVTFLAQAPGSSEELALPADDLVERVRPEMTLRFYENDRPLGKELVVILERAC